MKKTKYLLLIMLLALVALIFMPDTSNAAVSAERTLLTNDGSMKFKFSGLNLDTTHEYVFGFEKTSAIKSTKWYAITDFTATTATVNITTNSNHLAVFDAGDTGYITIKDKTTDVVIEKAYAVDLKLPYLNITNYDKAITNGYDLDNNNIKVGVRNADNSKAYYQYEKVTDQAVISKYKEIKKSNGSIKELQNVIKTSLPANSNWTQWGYFNGYIGHGGGYGYTQRKVSTPNEGLYYMWLYFQGTNIKDVYGCILVDNLTDEIALTSISLPSTKEVELGKTLTLTPTFNPSNTTDKTVTWTSSDESVATVNSNGVVTPKKVGSTIITVTSNVGKKTAKCTVTVKSSSSTTTDGWTDTSNTKIKIKKEDDTRYGYSITTENITYNKESRYYIYITSGKNKPTYTTGDNNEITDVNHVLLITNGKAGQSNGTRISKVLELNGDIYAWIVESKMNSQNKYENKFILEEYKVERPALNDIGVRIKQYYFDDYTSLYNNNPGDVNNARKVKIKIGTVNDNAILKSLEKKEAGALNKLLTYAKSAKSVYTDSLKVGTTDNWKISDKMKITYEQFYYVYFELDDENGKYYPVEDVMLYQGGLTTLDNYLNGNLKWNLNNENNSTSTPTDTTITPDKKLPQTGEKIAIIGTIGIAVVVAVVLGIKAKKYNF